LSLFCHLISHLIFLRNGSNCYGGYEENEYEINIVALELDKNKAVVIEVKRNKKNFKEDLLLAKTEQLKNKVLSNYSIETKSLSLDDL